ncbi:MAG TPA: fibro-slime domain-containing protein [Myxococcota bacterium]|nr:fibro-slime domain-containing protein [Myxococcota bacterium]
MSIRPGWCAIGGACFAEDDINPLEPCQVCLGGEGWSDATTVECLSICGNGLVEGNEGCDDRNIEGGDGCDEECLPERGFLCEGEPSICTIKCGDAIRLGDEACDNGGTTGGDGCDPSCRVEPGYQCDDNGCIPRCGDGWRLADEECDDGNLEAGDGCSSVCREELGFSCSEPNSALSAFFLPVIYHDFRAEPQDAPHPDFQAYISGLQAVLVMDTLGHDGVPIFARSGQPRALTGPEEFRQWFVTTEGVNARIDGVLPFNREGAAGAFTFAFRSSEYFPIDGLGFGDYLEYGHNYHFTSALKFRFRYQGGEKLSFTGDDDVWIFVNGRLALDLGGTHNPASATVELATQIDPAFGVRADTRFDIVEGGIYEVAVFHAERYTVGSNFNFVVTVPILAGNRSVCRP